MSLGEAVESSPHLFSASNTTQAPIQNRLCAAWPSPGARYRSERRAPCLHPTFRWHAATRPPAFCTPCPSTASQCSAMLSKLATAATQLPGAQGRDMLLASFLCRAERKRCATSMRISTLSSMNLPILTARERLRLRALLPVRCRRDIARALREHRFNAYLHPNPPSAIAVASPSIRYIWRTRLHRTSACCCCGSCC